MNFNRSLLAADEKAHLRAILSKQIVPFSMLALLVWLIWRNGVGLDFASIRASVNSITAAQWGLAVIGTILSFWAMGRMDAVAHRLIGTGHSDAHARMSGAAAVATAQMAGFGLLTGTLARWRILAGINLFDAAKVTAFVSLSFMVALGVLCAAMVLVAPTGLPWARPLAALGLILFTGFVAITLWRPQAILHLPLPPLKAQSSLFFLTLLDTCAAALTLYVLLPGETVPPLALFYTVFLLSLGLGLLGTTPGGIGPFEMMMLACFPQIPDAEILAAIMAYRLVYFACPAAIALCLLIAGPSLRWTPKPATGARLQSPADRRPVACSALTYVAHRAETGLLHQGEFQFLIDDNDRVVSLAAPTGQSLIMLADPLMRSDCVAATLHTLKTAAQDSFLTPCLYKCNARTAAAARRFGWSLLQISQEAVVLPHEYEIASPQHRQLRRLLRKAEKVGVAVKEAGAMIPTEAMRQIAKAWASDRAGGRGFSMGRFDAAYVGKQRVFLAYRDDRLIGFVTFHENWRELSLDLMCYTADAPAGTSHLLIHTAIEVAKGSDNKQVSLAAVPCITDRLRGPGLVKRWLAAKAGADGLRRFKSSFAPRWRPLYLASPNHAGLALAGVDLIDRITRPRQELSPDS